VQLVVVAGGAGLPMRRVPEADAADQRDGAQWLAVRGREPAAADERGAATITRRPAGPRRQAGSGSIALPVVEAPRCGEVSAHVPTH
jgi:hypothetical protein